MTTDLSGPSRRKHITRVATAAAVFAVDLATKIAASAALADRDIDLPGPLDLRLSHNPGVAFGMGNDTPTWLVLSLTGAVAAGIAVAAWRGLFASSIAAGVVVGGALANVADRSQAGTVVEPVLDPRSLNGSPDLENGCIVVLRTPVKDCGPT